MNLYSGGEDRVPDHYEFMAGWGDWVPDHYEFMVVGETGCLITMNLDWLERPSALSS